MNLSNKASEYVGAEASKHTAGSNGRDTEPPLGDSSKVNEEHSGGFIIRFRTTRITRIAGVMIMLQISVEC